MKFKKSNKKVDYVMNPYRKKKIKLTKISGFLFCLLFLFFIVFLSSCLFDFYFNF